MKSTFGKNEEQAIGEEEHDKQNCYIRPFLMPWRLKQLSFQTINQIKEIPKIEATEKYPRYVLHDFAKTWLENDCWFDKADIYGLLKDDLVKRLYSKLPTETMGRLYFATFCKF